MSSNEHDTALQTKNVALDLDPEEALGTYSNLVVISHSPSEFVLDFARIMPGVESPKIVRRIIMTPDHAKRFLGALHDNVSRYENSFGSIELKELPNPDTMINSSTSPEA